MISITVFDKIPGYAQETLLDTKEFEDTRLINDFKEKIQTKVIKNELYDSGYRNYRIISDEVYNQKVRVKGQIVDQVIMQEVYQAYINEAEENNKCITLCRKEDAIKVKEMFESRFGLVYEKHIFDLPKIIKQAADVRSAKFDVRIETVKSVTMKGTNVNSTNYYERLLRTGELNGIIVSYDLTDQTVTFRISMDGSIFLYNNLNDYQILDLVDELLRIA